MIDATRRTWTAADIRRHMEHRKRLIIVNKGRLAGQRKHSRNHKDKQIKVRRKRALVDRTSVRESASGRVETASIGRKYCARSFWLSAAVYGQLIKVDNRILFEWIWIIRGGRSLRVNECLCRDRLIANRIEWTQHIGMTHSTIIPNTPKYSFIFSAAN